MKKVFTRFMRLGMRPEEIWEAMSLAKRVPMVEKPSTSAEMLV